MSRSVESEVQPFGHADNFNGSASNGDFFSIQVHKMRSGRSASGIKHSRGQAHEIGDSVAVGFAKTSSGPKIGVVQSFVLI